MIEIHKFLINCIFAVQLYCNTATSFTASRYARNGIHNDKMESYIAFGVNARLSSSSSLVDDFEVANYVDESGPFSTTFSNYLHGIRTFQSSVDNMYSNALRLKCPFFKRRSTDLIDGLVLVIRFLLIRHKSLPLPIVPGMKGFDSEAINCMKSIGYNIFELKDVIENDWKGKSNCGKGYYITGKLSSNIYRDDCFFDGPDPDMPVRGLRKYTSAASQLFDNKSSRADLLSIEVNEISNSILVKWRLEGILNLPWHPKLKPWTGSTTYFIDKNGLVEKHVETWDITVIDAFLSTLFPYLWVGSDPAPPISNTNS